MTTTHTDTERKQETPVASFPPQGGQLKVHHFVIACFVGFVMIVIITYAFNSMIVENQDYEPSLVTEFSGSGNAKTEFFKVDDAWEMRWQHTGRIEKLEWRTKQGEGSMLIDMHRKPIREQGGVNWPKGGVYRVEVTAEGDWKLQIYQFRN